MSDFWIGFIIGGFICGFIGFLGAAILAGSGKASRMEEKMPDVIFRAIKATEEAKSIFGKMTHEAEIATKNNPRTD